KTRDQIIQDFLNNCGWDHSLRQSITGDASFRRYERIIQEDSEKHIRMAILMDCPLEYESLDHFLKIDEILRQNGLSAPEVLAKDEKNGFLLLEDLKVDSFSLVLSGASLFNSDYLVEQRLYKVAVEAIVKMQSLDVEQSVDSYDDDLLLKESILFPEWYLPYKNVTLNIGQKRHFAYIMQNIIKEIEYKNTCFVHRDYHADNLIWLPGREGIERVGILDFQDAVFGCPAYDLVSLLEDARRDVSSATVLAMIDYYLELRPDLDPEKFKRSYALLGAQRNLKIIGIFSRLAVRDRKTKYLGFLPRVWAHLEHEMQHEPLLAELKNWLDEVIPDRTEDPRMHKMAHLLGSIQSDPEN
ncbi:MAG: phosphotransferase, partial [Rickettsiales bacterium]|nr:phosphotransferase [Rickettsiales bacterium]